MMNRNYNWKQTIQIEKLNSAGLFGNSIQIQLAFRTQKHHMARTAWRSGAKGRGKSDRSAVAEIVYSMLPL